MKRAYTEMSQEAFKEILGDALPEDAQIYGFEITPNTASIRIYFYSNESPDMPENTMSAFYYPITEEEPKKQRRR